MNAIVRNVREIEDRDRQALEHVLGQPLTENQRVVIQIESVPAPVVPAINGAPAKLPDWCNVYEGLSEEQIADIEQIALSRAEMTRPFQVQICSF